jgi:hypothetical protein
MDAALPLGGVNELSMDGSNTAPFNIRDFLTDSEQFNGSRWV